MTFDAVAIHRWSRSVGCRRVPFAARALVRLNLLLFAAQLPPELELDEDSLFGRGGRGIFIHPKARIGRHCVIAQFVSIGAGAREGAPVVGDYVRIGAGARLLGPVKVGPFAVIDQNAVVTEDVPAGAVVSGSPARTARMIEDPVLEYERDTGRRVEPEDRLLMPERVRTPELAEPLIAAESFLEAAE